MKLKIFTFSIIILILIISFLSSAQKIEINKNILNNGEFEAQIGLNRNIRPIAYLDGNFNMRGRVISVRGIFTSSNIESRFKGAFFSNSFFIKIPERAGTQTIFGRIRVNEDHSTFIGSWNSRGFYNQGWISGEFKTREYIN